MDAGTAKKLIEKNLSYDEVKRLTVKLVQHASPQTAIARSGTAGAGVDQRRGQAGVGSSRD